MSKTASIAVTVITIVGDGNTATLQLPTQSNTSSPFEHIAQALSNGVTTLTVPTGALFLVIIPPTGSIITKTLKGVSGDTGIPLAPAGTSLLALPASPPATLVLTANGIETVDVYWL